MSGDHILLLHGQPGKARDWAPVIDALGPDVDALALERPGWEAGAPTGLAGNALAALAALDARSIQRAVVVGHSFGAGVAAWLAFSSPDRVRALVLAAPAANRSSLVWVDRLLATPGVGPLTSAGVLASVGGALALRPVRALVGRGLRLRDGDLRGASRRLASPRAWRAFAVEQRALIGELPALEASLGAISAPTTIVAGTADRIVPIASARALARQIPNAQLVELAGVDHLLPLREPERLAELILAAAR